MAILSGHWQARVDSDNGTSGVDMTEKATLVREWPWSAQRGQGWFSPDQLSYRGLCAWNHSEEDLARATRIVVTETPQGQQDSYACCDECYQSMLRYVGAVDDV